MDIFDPIDSEVGTSGRFVDPREVCAPAPRVAEGEFRSGFGNLVYEMLEEAGFQSSD